LPQVEARGACDGHADCSQAASVATAAAGTAPDADTLLMNDWLGMNDAGPWKLEEEVGRGRFVQVVSLIHDEFAIHA
jgi:hypothetical protein